MKTTLTEYQTETVRWLRRTRPTIYFIVKRVSQSGMFRLISFFTIRDNRPFPLDNLIATTTHYKQDKSTFALRVSGCGMDMGFAVIYDFGRSIFPNGYKYRKNEAHRNGTPEPKETDGGYAFRYQNI